MVVAVSLLFSRITSGLSDFWVILMVLCIFYRKIISSIVLSTGIYNDIMLFYFTT